MRNGCLTFGPRCVALVFGGVGGTTVANGQEAEAVDIGRRRELFVDDYLIGSLEGGARQQLHHPVPREIVLEMDRPWEGNGCGYMTLIQDGELYRLYYRGANVRYTETSYEMTRPQVYCYAESRDGIHWTRPDLGMVEFEGSKGNNILLSQDTWGGVAHNFSPFLDANPEVPAEERFKALAGGPPKALVSPDGIHWKIASDEPVITVGAFDSQNIAFFDGVRGQYRAYQRAFRDGRDIKTETSTTFFGEWTDAEWLDYVPSRGGELYTNQVTPYHRAPHVFLGFPTRYEDRGLTPATKHLPQWDLRQLRMKKSRREGTAVTEGLFMASRDGRTFRAWEEAFIRPGPRTENAWFYGDGYQALNLVETAASLAPDAPNELSMYSTEGGKQNDRHIQLRRYTLRLDGFVSVTAPMDGGSLITKPLRFAGGRLTLNYSSSARGGVRGGFLDAEGKPVEGNAVEDCPWIYGDAIERVVEWRRGEGVDAVTTDVSALAGRPVRIVFELKDADLYSLQFR